MSCRYQCPACGYVYDEDQGDPDEGFSPGTLWTAIPKDWFCPDCAVRDKVDFVLVQESSADDASELQASSSGFS